MTTIETIRFRNDTQTRKRLMVPESFQHPAKGQLGMWATMIERYSQPGDLVLDPMSGSGATLLAALMGRNVICVELEQHFVEPMRRSWEKMRTMPMLGYEMGQAVILRGDARCLPLPDASVGTAITSPPYEGHTSANDEQRFAASGKPFTERAKREYDYRPVVAPWEVGKLTVGARAIPVLSASQGVDDVCPICHDEVGHLINCPNGSAFTSKEMADTHLRRPVDAIVTSPPFQDQEPNHLGGTTDFSQVGGIGHAQVVHYGGSENIGNLRNAAYWDAMSRVYSECWRVLKPGGIMALVLKGFTRDGVYQDLPGQTEALLLEAGWQKHDEWRRQLWSLSFWRILQKRRSPETWDERLGYESILAFRKPEQTLALSAIASAFVESGVYEVKDVSVFAKGLLGMVGDDVFTPQHIISMCDGLKMGRVYTDRATAQMVEFHAIWDSLARQLISESVGHDMTAAPICATTYREHPIAVGTGVALPFPTALCFVDLRPETLGNILAYTCFCTACSQKPMVVHGTKPTGEDTLAAILGSAYVHVSMIDQWRSTVNDTRAVDSIITSPPFEDQTTGHDSEFETPHGSYGLTNRRYSKGRT